MLALYRKYRPKTFSEVVGQEHVVKTLTNAISMGRVSHAYLFYGTRGVGKTTLARLLAKAVNCQNRKEGEYEPCNQCISCREINEGNALDLIEIDAASNRGIDEIRSLKEEINVVPVRSKYKVYIIDEAHQLTKEASNALLKTLEEPPLHAIFILCTTEFHKILPTIASRCQRFEFKKLTLPQIVKKLEFICSSEKIKVEKGALEIIAKAAEGSSRDAESLLNDVINLEKKVIKKKTVEEILGIVGVEPVSRLVEFFIKKEKRKALEYLSQIFQRGIDVENFSKELISYLRDLLLVKINPEIFDKNNIFTEEEKERLKEQVNRLSEKDLRKILKIFLEAQAQMKWTEFPQLPLELATIETIDSL